MPAAGKPSRAHTSEASWLPNSSSHTGQRVRAGWCAARGLFACSRGRGRGGAAPKRRRLHHRRRCLQAQAPNRQVAHRPQQSPPVPQTPSFLTSILPLRGVVPLDSRSSTAGGAGQHAVHMSGAARAPAAPAPSREPQPVPSSPLPAAFRLPSTFGGNELAQQRLRRDLHHLLRRQRRWRAHRNEHC